jgi:short-subunit dehydrogenase
MPLLNIYSSSKAYVAHLTHNLSKEYPQFNWLVLTPSFVTTAMNLFM